MHDFLLSIINDTIDKQVQNEIIDFHTKSQNRIERDFLPFGTSVTLLSSLQIEALQWSEHAFGSHEHYLGIKDMADPLDFQRKRSAEKFIHYPELSESVFSKVIVNSFAADIKPEEIKIPYPSGGAIYSGQVIVFIKNVQGIKVGAYHYLPISNKLERLDALSTKWVEDALFIVPSPKYENYDFFILYGSLVSKHVCKYGHRGYRLCLMEIGSMYRNAEIQATNHNLTSRVWGGFRDEPLSVALGVDPRVIYPMICQLFGRSSC